MLHNVIADFENVSYWQFSALFVTYTDCFRDFLIQETKLTVFERKCFSVELSKNVFYFYIDFLFLFWCTLQKCYITYTVILDECVILQNYYKMQLITLQFGQISCGFLGLAQCISWKTYCQKVAIFQSKCTHETSAIQCHIKTPHFYLW